MAEHLMNAAVSVEACRAVLCQHGQHGAAMALRGLEMFDVSAARTAYGILRALPVTGTDALTAKAEALNALALAASTDTAQA